ncbi:hypothetical protein [Thiohalobacter thiocyanaticus]|nr:hypothetical protein [Thiohalobacter thiocyanaticus]
MTLLLTACAMSFDTFNRALPKLKDKNINVAIDYLGIPDHEYVVAGKKVYVWTTSERNPFPTAVTTTTTGNAGNQPFNATSTSYIPDPGPLSCTIKMQTEQDIVRRIEYEGNNGTCFKYSDRLKPLITQ